MAKLKKDDSRIEPTPMSGKEEVKTVNIMDDPVMRSLASAALENKTSNESIMSNVNPTVTIEQEEAWRKVVDSPPKEEPIIPAVFDYPIIGQERNKVNYRDDANVLYVLCYELLRELEASSALIGNYRMRSRVIETMDMLRNEIQEKKETE